MMIFIYLLKVFPLEIKQNSELISSPLAIFESLICLCNKTHTEQKKILLQIPKRQYLFTLDPGTGPQYFYALDKLKYLYIIPG